MFKVSLTFLCCTVGHSQKLYGKNILIQNLASVFRNPSGLSENMSSRTSQGTHYLCCHIWASVNFCEIRFGVPFLPLFIKLSKSTAQQVIHRKCYLVVFSSFCSSEIYYNELQSYHNRNCTEIIKLYLMFLLKEPFGLKVLS